MVNITARQLALRLENPFKLSYGTSTVRENVLVQIDDGTYTGVGEAAVVPYYHETPERILKYLSDPAVAKAVGADPFLLEDALDRLLPAESPAARAAVDMALHDLWAQHLGQPLYRLWGLNRRGFRTARLRWRWRMMRRLIASTSAPRARTS